MDQIDTTEAKKAIEADKQQRAEACQAALTNVLSQYRCDLDVAVVLRTGQIQPQLTIIAKD